MCSTFENSFSTREQGAPESHFILPNYLVLVHISLQKKLVVPLSYNRVPCLLSFLKLPYKLGTAYIKFVRCICGGVKTPKMVMSAI
jgi:hypothetical protein